MCPSGMINSRPFSHRAWAEGPRNENVQPVYLNSTLATQLISHHPSSVITQHFDKLGTLHLDMKSLQSKKFGK